MGFQLHLVGKGLLLLSVFFVRASGFSTCTTVEVAGAEGDLSGTYIYDGTDFIRRGGSTSYILGKHTNDQWRLGEGFYLYYALDNYPHYYTYDTADHPVDANEAWQLVASDNNEEEAPSSFSITCSDTSSSSPISSTCTAVEVAGAEGDLSGTYKYDGADFIRRGGSTSYILGKHTNDQWRLGEGFYLYYALDYYPHYYTYDAVDHPVDIEETWQLVASSGNQDEAPTSFSVTCSDTSTSSSTAEILWICASVIVSGAEGDLSGNYTYDSDGNYIRSEGDTSYILGKYSNDQWLLGEGSSFYYVPSNFPYYFTYDDADSPIDIDQEWQLVAGESIEGSASSNFSVTCEGGFYDYEGNYNAARIKNTLPLAIGVVVVPAVMGFHAVSGWNGYF